LGAGNDACDCSTARAQPKAFESPHQTRTPADEKNTVNANSGARAGFGPAGRLFVQQEGSRRKRGFAAARAKIARRRAIFPQQIRSYITL
jgi:hypothetical protein